MAQTAFTEPAPLEPSCVPVELLEADAEGIPLVEAVDAGSLATEEAAGALLEACAKAEAESTVGSALPSRVNSEGTLLIEVAGELMVIVKNPESESEVEVIVVDAVLVLVEVAGA